MGFLFNRKKSAIPQNATFRITQNGEDKLQEFNGDPKHQVLMALETRGSMDVEEISSASGLNKGAVERLVPALVRGGYIQYITTQSPVDLE